MSVCLTFSLKKKLQFRMMFFFSRIVSISGYFCSWNLWWEFHICATLKTASRIVSNYSMCKYSACENLHSSWLTVSMYLFTLFGIQCKERDRHGKWDKGNKFIYTQRLTNKWKAKKKMREMKVKRKKHKP